MKRILVTAVFTIAALFVAASAGAATLWMVVVTLGTGGLTWMVSGEAEGGSSGDGSDGGGDGGGGGE